MSQSSLTLARPYARAAFAVARDSGCLAQWSKSLAISAQIAGDPHMAGALMNPTLTLDDALVLLAPDDQEAGESFSRFLGLLFENSRLSLLPEIAGMYEQLRADEEKILQARVTSASELSADELESLRNALKKRFGREVKLDVAIDASLIGGAVIDAGDIVIDGSLKSKLARLQTVLTN
ncbi:MAG: F0F1 ATP synthase subunit delta [Xanthomonadaceae bacterium]|jgi:F-type H+-transporting ATPase subunit delta|nr:F0F1 ATP synthase subunit delta [Xanthomonadaceae bacterium]